MMGLRRGLSGNELKILAAVLMTVDHVGMILFPTVAWFRAVGRAAFPIFAYMIAEGCRHTRDRRRYLLTVVCAAVPCQIVFSVAERSAYMCVLVTFACSISLILLYEWVMHTRSVGRFYVLAATLVGVYVLYRLGRIYGRPLNFDVDYGLVGILLPLLIYIGRDRRERWCLTAVGLMALSLVYGAVQWWCLTALIPLALYNGTRGRKGMKYGFYIYYPLHIAVLQGIAYIL